MKTLHLTVTKQWFDLMAKGIKKVEYREMKMYWLKRLTNPNVPIGHPDRFLKFDQIHIKNGYQKNAPLLIVEHLETDSTSPKLITYSDGTKLHLKTSCYQLHLGKIIKIENYETNNN